MATPVIMPRQGQSVESCIITKWNKQVGDSVAVGDILFSYETDKAAFDEEAKEAGTVLAIFFNEGDDDVHRHHGAISLLRARNKIEIGARIAVDRGPYGVTLAGLDGFKLYFSRLARADPGAVRKKIFNGNRLIDPFPADETALGLLREIKFGEGGKISFYGIVE